MGGDTTASDVQNITGQATGSNAYNIVGLATNCRVDQANCQVSIQYTASGTSAGKIAYMIGTTPAQLGTCVAAGSTQNSCSFTIYGNVSTQQTVIFTLNGNVTTAQFKIGGGL
jgi:hypothetical protein